MMYRFYEVTTKEALQAKDTFLIQYLKWSYRHIAITTHML